ncbi:MAG: FMN-binding protein [Chloroflexota bacterium]
MRTSTIKSIAAVILTAIGSALVVGFRAADVPVRPPTTGVPGTTSGSGSSSGSTSSGSTSSGSSTTSTGGAGTATSPPAATKAPASSATYADGAWTGQAVDEPWGTFQVQAIVSGGTLTNVVVVAEPGDGHSSRINSQAVPILTQAVVAAQTANVDMVSGATWTSDSYLTSLQAALDQAKAAVQTGG